MKVTPVLAIPPVQTYQGKRFVEYCRWLDGTEILPIFLPEYRPQIQYPENPHGCLGGFAIHEAAKAADGGAFLHLEVDSIPLKKGWLKDITDAYNNQDRPFLMTASHHPPIDLTGGIGVFDSQKFRELVPVQFENTSADLYIYHNLSQCVTKTPLIQHDYAVYKDGKFVRQHRFPQDDKIIDPEAVIFHCDKNQDIIEYRMRHPRNPQEKYMAIGLQFHPRDIDSAIDLAKLIEEMEPTKRDDVEFILLYTPSCDLNDVKTIANILAKKFYIKGFKSHRSGTGWPVGPNDLWQDSMTTLAVQRRAGKVSSNFILTMEPDCCPFPGWIDALKAAWNSVDCEVVGYKDLTNRWPHINGNAMFSTMIMLNHQELAGCPGTEAWDTSHGKLLVRIGANTELIHQKYQCSNISEEEMEYLSQLGIALLHGVKGPSAREIMRARIRKKDLQPT